MTKSLLVECHPRIDSLTMAVSTAFRESAAGVEFDVADLYREEFDPRLTIDDEPDWHDPEKRYSNAVRHEMARIERNAATVLVFPIWWWSFPAMLKGWIDRVFNHGWAYGGRDYPHKDVWMLAIAGNDKDAYIKRRYDDAINTQLKVGVLDYCGVERPRIEMLYGAIEGEKHVESILDRSRTLGSEFAATLSGVRS
ncbi:MAG: NAD(P)H oxidoreductase [Pseudomonadota bacterium]